MEQETTGTLPPGDGEPPPPPPGVPPPPPPGTGKHQLVEWHRSAQETHQIVSYDIMSESPFAYRTTHKDRPDYVFVAQPFYTMDPDSTKHRAYVTTQWDSFQPRGLRLVASRKEVGIINTLRNADTAVSVGTGMTTS